MNPSKLSPGEWPHQFIKDSPPYKGPSQPPFNGRDLYKLRCVHCGTSFAQGLQYRPKGSCPARNDKGEKSRLFNKRF